MSAHLRAHVERKYVESHGAGLLVINNTVFPAGLQINKDGWDPICEITVTTVNVLVVAVCDSIIASVMAAVIS